MYGSEPWTLKEKGKARITAAEMECLRKTVKYTLIVRGMKISYMNSNATCSGKKKKYCKIEWIRHVRRMDRSRLPNAIMKY
jgi:hypothetical protein